MRENAWFLHANTIKYREINVKEMELKLVTCLNKCPTKVHLREILIVSCVYYHFIQNLYTYNTHIMSVSYVFPFLKTWLEKKKKHLFVSDNYTYIFWPRRRTDHEVIIKIVCLSVSNTLFPILCSLFCVYV